MEIGVDITVSTTTKQSTNRLDIVIHDKKRKEIIIIEVTSQDQLEIVENEKAKKYDVLASEIRAMHNCKTRIISYVRA